MTQLQLDRPPKEFGKNAWSKDHDTQGQANSSYYASYEDTSWIVSMIHQELGLTWGLFARAIGMKYPNDIHKFRNGKSRPSAALMVRMNMLQMLKRNGLLPNEILRNLRSEEGVKHFWTQISIVKNLVLEKEHETGRDFDWSRFWELLRMRWEQVYGTTDNR